MVRVPPLPSRCCRSSCLDKKSKLIGACSGYRRAGLFLPGHLIPAALLNEFRPCPATYFRELLKFLYMIGLLHELGDADRRLARHDRLFGQPLRSAGGSPTTPREADDHCDDCPT